MALPDSATLGEARAWLRQRIYIGECRYNGETCPCCQQRAQVYKRSIHSTMARELIRCYRAVGMDWFHLPTILGHNGGDVTKCRWWGLMEEDPTRRNDGGRAGQWRITPVGADFIERRTTVPRFADSYDNKLLGVHGDQVDIVDCLNKRFHYDELMAGV